jgi:hypothetical protein
LQDKTTTIVYVYDVSYDSSTMNITKIEPSVITPQLETNIHLLIKKSPLF